MQMSKRATIPAAPMADLRAKLSRIEHDVSKMKKADKQAKQESPPETWPLSIKSPYL
jgi:hypothetical protein